MEFDIEKSFDDNLEMFRLAISEADPECAKILLDNLHLLQQSGKNDRDALKEFHAAVSEALDELNPEDAAD